MKDVSYRPQSNQDSKAEGAQSSQQGAMIGKGLALKDLWIFHQMVYIQKKSMEHPQISQENYFNRHSLCGLKETENMINEKRLSDHQNSTARS